MNPPTYPARPMNGGRFDLAPKKRGLWFVQPKYNGWRALIETATGSTWNRHGERLALPAEFNASIAKLGGCGIEWLDCEALTRRAEIGFGSLVVLDAVVPKLLFAERRRLLAEKFPVLSWSERPGDGLVALVDTLRAEEGDLLWSEFQHKNAEFSAHLIEGFVMKRDGSEYPFQLRSPKLEYAHWVKHRFDQIGARV